MFEVCMDSFSEHFPNHGPRRHANCVGKNMFNGTMYGPEEGESAMRISTVLEKGGYSSASMVMSDSEGTTPTDVDIFNVDTWPEMGKMSSQTCHDCVNVQTGAIATDIKALKAEAKVVTAGAAIGVLWLAVLSG